MKKKDKIFWLYGIVRACIENDDSHPEMPDETMGVCAAAIMYGTLCDIRNVINVKDKEHKDADKIKEIKQIYKDIGDDI